ncbi:family 43 glycosylhydrolase [Opitutus terrae]|uniref:Alpha-N-arabinofuranosidase n=1 Tax=Opitutus terrae (strain DSM 11246 / JCM 15787 / PB90-1) TaxID=452637 RepID=B1ZN53_OPITP|nr:family 43 glycosylhydrolase [Opitutus terrae]ACB76504.1 Alpha-N-arabinofuranosidase [Opitutus terrae PB90-1]
MSGARIGIGLAALCVVGSAFGTNPLILDQFTADPTARVFEGKVYVYPSHDILATEGRGRPGWFCMEDYHVFSSVNLTDWTDHGVILTQTGVDWVNADSYSLWAPDCIARDGKYYFYFPAIPKSGEKGFRIGVAVADQPAGPFRPEPAPIEGVRGIDPCVFIDHDGTPYLYYSHRKIFVAKLQDNMRQLAGPVQTIANLPAKGLIEGPFVFERNGIYYLTYPHVENRIERLEYAIADHPLGPFKPAGVILDESASGCWTVHQSIIEYRGQWYLFYHDRDLSPNFDKARSIRADRLFFNEDGTIRKVIPTLRGVGLVAADGEIQIDRTSATSGAAVVVSFLNAASPAAGWKLALNDVGAWVRFDQVDFAQGGQKLMQARSRSASGGTIEVRLDAIDGPVLARLQIDPGTEWTMVSSPVHHVSAGVHDLFATLVGGHPVELDWLRFE